MIFRSNTATKKLLELSKRIRVVAGGTSASKTISILLILIDKAQSDKTPTLTSITSESVPHLKKGVMRDFLNIMQGHNYYNDNSWNRTDYIYTFPSGSKIEFFGSDSPDKTRGPRRDRLFVNEANNVSYEAFDQMEVRTRGEVWIDFNPTYEFWVYTRLLIERKDDIDFITLTYLDNESLEESIKLSIESHKNNKNWWTVYGLGKLGEVEGRIYTNWVIVDEIPHEARLERYGLDFGYSNDPTAIIAVYYYNGGYIFDEVAYQKGLSNRSIADVFTNIEKAMIKADSAEPKSIDELKSYGLMVIPAQKGPGSVTQGIQAVQAQKVSMTKRSLNLIKEYRNYMWETDRDGKILNVAQDSYNHCLDAVRYGMEQLTGYTEEIELPEFQPVFSRTGY